MVSNSDTLINHVAMVVLVVNADIASFAVTCLRWSLYFAKPTLSKLVVLTVFEKVFLISLWN